MYRSSSTWIAADLATAHLPLVRLAELMAGRAHLAVLPTPLHLAPRLSQALGREVWLKRDDLTGTALGGNKIRKMELVAAAALVEGADTLVTVGAAQSNHVRTVATAAAMIGMECHAILTGDAPARSSGNLVLDEPMGARLHWPGVGDWASLAAAAETLTEALTAQGRRVHAVPVGGSTPLGAAGYVAAYLELVVQLTREGLDADAVYCASSSGGTQAGLHLGRMIARHVLAEELPDGSTPPVVGVDVARIHDPLSGAVAGLVRGAAELLGVADIALVPEDPLGLDGIESAITVITDQLGPGYALPTPASTAALHQLAHCEGVLVDPVYSAKALAAVPSAPGEGPIVFWHTGGVPALFALDGPGPDGP